MTIEKYLPFPGVNNQFINLNWTSWVIYKQMTMRSNSYIFQKFGHGQSKILYIIFIYMLHEQSGKTAKRGIPQLRYIYRDCGIYSVFLFFGLYFRFSMSSRGWFSCLACFHGWNTEPSRMFSDRISRFCQFWFWKTLIQLYFDWCPHQSQNSERAFVFVQLTFQ